MATVRVRSKNQITLPASLVRQSGIRENDELNVAYVNGVITLMPKTRAAHKDNLMDYAGLAGASYGKTDKQIDGTIAKLRNEWTR